LAGQGKQVRVLDLNPVPQELPPEVEILTGSILDKDLLNQAMQGVGVVYHLAAIPHLWVSDTTEYQKVNVEGTRCILEAASQFDLDRFVYTSSETVLRGWRKRGQGPIDESQPLPKPEELPGPYSRSKLMAQLEVHQAIENGLPGIVVYPTVPIGPGDDNMTPPARMIRDFLNGKNPAYLECNLNLIPVQAVAEGHILAAEKGQVDERYILGQDNYKLSEVLQLIEEFSGLKMPGRKVSYNTAVLTARAMEFASRISGKVPAASVEGVRLAGAGFTFDCSKARNELGLPQYAIPQSLQETIHYLRHG
jgi:dihydroflavonol-4-reductase